MEYVAEKTRRPAIYHTADNAVRPYIWESLFSKALHQSLKSLLTPLDFRRNTQGFNPNTNLKP